MTDLDETDRALLALLRRDGRLSITEIAHRLEVSRTTARSRFDGLVQSGRIRRFTIETDLDEKEGVRAITMVELQGKMSRAVTRALTRMPEVSAVFATNGHWDLVVEIQAETLADFDQVLRNIREVPGVVNSQSNLLLAQVTG